MLYEFDQGAVPAVFVCRVNRFLAEVSLQGHLELVHVPNSGRLTSVLASGQICWLLPQPGLKRQTRFSLLGVETAEGTVLTDAQLPNQLVAAAWREHLIPEFCAYQTVRTEYTFAGSRLDLAFFHPSRPDLLVEVKSAADFQGPVARFPDAPSLRATKHLNELAQAARDGYQAAVLFVAQQSRVERIMLNASIDSTLVSAARQAAGAGVHFLGYTLCPDLPRGIHWGRPIPVELT